MKKKWNLLIALLLIGIYGIFFITIFIKESHVYTGKDKWGSACESYLAGDPVDISDTIKKYCQEEYHLHDSFLEMHSSLIIQYLNGFTLPVVFFTVLTCAIWVSSFLKNKVFAYYAMRIPYKNIIKKILKEAYRFIWVLPACMIGLFLLEIFKKGLVCNLGACSTEIWGNFFQNHSFIFISIYLFNIILYLSIYINITLVWLKKYKNYIVAVISSFLTILAIEIFFENVINVPSLINLINFFRFNTRLGLDKLLIFGISCCLLSWGAVYMAYRNKEKLYLDIKK